jgi:hypothetical protein
MPHRETKQKNVINKWEGCNQRLQPTLVPDGFFTFAKGVQFGLSSNAERLTGKQVYDKLSGPIFNITAWGEFAIVQLKDSVAMYLTPGSGGGGPITGGGDRITVATDTRITVLGDTRITV